MPRLATIAFMRVAKVRLRPSSFAAVRAAYEAEDDPDEKALKKLAKEVGAPSPACVKTFFDSLHWVLQNR